MKFFRALFYATIFIFIAFCFYSVSFGATLNLKATWTPNVEPGVAGYNLYRIDGERVKINPTLIPFHPGPGLSSYLFSTTVPDNSTGTISFVLRAVNISLIESADSTIALHTYSTIVVSAPINLAIQLR